MSKLKPGWVDAIASQVKAEAKEAVPRFQYPSVRQKFLEATRARGRRSGTEKGMQESRTRGAQKTKLNQFQEKALDFEFPEDDL